MKTTAIQIVKKLVDHGFRAYFAGGCVRDLLLGLEPHDYDIATNAKPEQIEGLFAKTIPIGKKFGIIIVVEDNYHFEIATFRSDSGYTDGRRPDAVLFTDPREDARRRDFTINGMFYDPLKKKVIDYVDGQKDLKERLVHFIGNPGERIQEDNLRILRAVRLVHQLHGQYHPETYKALKRYAHLIKNVSTERIRDELTRILLGKNRAQGLQDLAEIGILEHILPELMEMQGVAQPQQYHQEGSVWQHMLRSLHAITHHPSSTFVWTVMLHDVGKPRTFAVEERIRFNKHAETGSEMARQILKRFKFSRKVIEEVSWLIAHHMSVGNILHLRKERKAKWVLHPYFPQLLALLKADASGTIPKDLGMYREIRDLAKKVKAGLPKKIPKLISGDILMENFHIAQGPRVGEILDKVHTKQLRGEIKTKQAALEYVDQLLRKK